MPPPPQPDQNHDPAIKFTLAYLKLIEKNLNISYLPHGEPICIHENLTSNVISKLRDDLGHLLTGPSGVAAIEASKIYGQDHVQSIAFGHASDFDALIKVGFLYSERIVVWDILSSRLLTPCSASSNIISVIADVACNLLLLKPVAEKGGVVVLPHPLTWSEKAQKVFKELSEADIRSASSLGLAVALVAIDEGIHLHPYTLTNRKNNRDISAEKKSSGRSFYSEENHDFGLAATKLMRTEEFSFLRSVPLYDFYQITLAHPELQRALRKLFSVLNGLSSQQASAEMKAIFQELKKLGAARDRGVSNYKIDGAIATAGLAISTLTMATSVTGATILAVLGVSMTAITTTRSWLARPEKNVIVHAFSDLRSSKPFAVKFPTSFPKIDVEHPIEDPIVIDHVRNIMAEDWTEDAHKYLGKLPGEMVIKVLAALRPEQKDQLVNFRSRQNDYIGDYLEFVWRRNQSAFWSHIEQTFMSNEGMLMYDLQNVHTILASKDMPLSTWLTLLRFIPEVYGDILTRQLPNHVESSVAAYQIETLTEVVSFQLMKSKSKVEKQASFVLWLSNLDQKQKSVVHILLLKIFPSELPAWLQS